MKVELESEAEKTRDKVKPKPAADLEILNTEY